MERYSFSLSPVVPAPSVVIEEVGMPFNGSQYILSCNVTVDDSVDTAVNISSQWLLPLDEVSNNTEIREQQHNPQLIFRPLCSDDKGNYTCTTTISPTEHDMFVHQVTAKNTEYVVVESEYIHTAIRLRVYYNSTVLLHIRTASSRSGYNNYLQYWVRRR